MAAFSMCLQLLADEIVAKFKWLSEKFGLKKKEGEEDEKNDDEEGGKNT